jgi:hypothetical protein
MDFDAVLEKDRADKWASNYHSIWLLSAAKETLAAISQRGGI